MFKSIKIENFRGIKKLEIDDFKQVNLFVGGNNSGKTSVLEALYACINPNNPSLIFRTDIFRELYNLKVSSSGNANTILKPLFSENCKSLFYNMDFKENINLSFNIGVKSQNKKEKIHQFNLLIKAHVGLLGALTDSSRIGGSTTELVSDIEKLINEFTVIESKRKNDYIAELFQKEERGSWSVEIKPDDKFTRLIGGTFIPSKLPPAEELETKVSKVVDLKKKEIVVNLLKSIDNRIQSFELSNGVVKFDIGLTRLINIKNLGDGIFKIFRIVVEILSESELEGGILLIDEIENGLHYTSQSKLWNWLFKIAKEKNIQIFATTHSMDCVKAFAEASEKSDEARLYRLEKEGEAIYPIKYDKDSLEVILERLKSAEQQFDWEVR